MKTFLSLTILIFTSACATKLDLNPENTKQKQEEEKQSKRLLKAKVIDALEAHSLPMLEEAVGKRKLKGQFDLHNLLAYNCGYPDIARYLIQKGATPVEKEVRDDQLPRPLYLPPLEVTLRKGCADLAQVYLESMNPADVAKGSMAINLSGLVPEWNVPIPKDDDPYFMRHPEDVRVENANKRSVALLAKKKNDEFCQQGQTQNCQAATYVEQQLRILAQERANSLLTNACNAYTQQKAYQQRMEMQLEFGERTGVASPKTYDRLVEGVQTLEGDLKYYKDTYFYETGQELNLNSCQ